MMRTRPPLHDWRRRHPTARRIAADLLAHVEVLGLRTRRLMADIRALYAVGDCTARTAVAIARREA